jgi:hypothetical protein
MDTAIQAKQIAQLLLEFDGRLRLARAAELALCNRMLEAEALLCPEGFTNANALELDLLARIHTRNNCFVEARRCWDRAISVDQGNRAKFEECVRLLDDYCVHFMRRRKIEWWFTLALLISSLAIGLWTLLRSNFMTPT